MENTYYYAETTTTTFYGYQVQNIPEFVPAHQKPEPEQEAHDGSYGSLENGEWKTMYYMNPGTNAAHMIGKQYKVVNKIIEWTANKGYGRVVLKKIELAPGRYAMSVTAETQEGMDFARLKLSHQEDLLENNGLRTKGTVGWRQREASEEWEGQVTHDAGASVGNAVYSDSSSPSSPRSSCTSKPPAPHSEPPQPEFCTLDDMIATGFGPRSAPLPQYLTVDVDQSTESAYGSSDEESGATSNGDIRSLAGISSTSSRTPSESGTESSSDNSSTYASVGAGVNENALGWDRESGNPVTPGGTIVSTRSDVIPSYPRVPDMNLDERLAQQYEMLGQPDVECQVNLSFPYAEFPDGYRYGYPNDPQCQVTSTDGKIYSAVFEIRGGQGTFSHWVLTQGF